MVTIRLERVAKAYGDHVAVDDVDLTIDHGEFVVLLGPSGCGKTTILRMIAGLDEPTEGDITVDGVSVTRLETRRRHLGMLFQQSALYPHLTVRENIGFPLKLAGVRQREITRAVEDLAATVGLGHVLDVHPRRLSGGMRQRAALARAVIRSPELLLMDEPMSNVDAKLRTHLRTELAMLHRSLGATAVYVTHDQAEAMALADRIAVVRAGRIVQCDAPMELYLRPNCAFVATFVGTPPTHLFAARLVATAGRVVAMTPAGPIPLGPQRRHLADHAGRTVAVGIRPDGVRVVDRRVGDESAIRAQVTGSVSVGDHHELEVSLAAAPVTADPLPVIGADDVTTLVIPSAQTHDVDLWRPIALDVDADRVLVFDLATGASLDDSTAPTPLASTMA